MTLSWHDVDEIALDLLERYPGLDPLTLKLPDIKNRVVGLAEFADDPSTATDDILEAIQAAWFDAYEDQA